MIHPPPLPDDILDHDERIPLFTRPSETDPELPYGCPPSVIPTFPDGRTFLTPFSALWTSKTMFVQLKTAQIITVFLSSETAPIATNILQPFLKHPLGILVFIVSS